MRTNYLKYKGYAHFDEKMSIFIARKVLKNSELIKKHGFYPFLHYTIKMDKLEKVNGKLYAKKEPKKREIFYCAHLDRYIYQDCAYKLGLKYNDYTIEHEIDDCSAAYRINKGKCNIHFAYEMFNYLKNQNNSYVIIGDFTSFFDNLNHFNLKRRLETVTGGKLNNDFYKIFKSITKYKYVNITDLYDYFTHKYDKRLEKYYLRKLKRLMSNDEFKIFIKMKNTKDGHDYLQRNEKDYGIVQGSPLSGLFANIYMIDFDKQMKLLAEKYSGKYLRYSDDFMLIADSSKTDIDEIYNKIQEAVNDAGKIELKDEKTKKYFYDHTSKSISRINTNRLIEVENDIINFLGFSFDGKNISIRNKTMTKYFYKMDRRIKQYLKNKKGVTVKSIYKKFTGQGNSNNCKNKARKKRKGNFISYVKRSEKIFKREKLISDVRKNSKKKVTEKIGRNKENYIKRVDN